MLTSGLSLDHDSHPISFKLGYGRMHVQFREIENDGSQRGNFVGMNICKVSPTQKSHNLRLVVFTVQLGPPKGT